MLHDLVNDEEHPYFVKENRKSMKNVTVNDNIPCVMSEVLPPKGRTKDITVSSVDDSDIILNLTTDDENHFESKNKILFQKMTDLDENGELVVNDEEFDYTLVELVQNLRYELRSKRLEVLENAESEILEEVA